MVTWYLGLLALLGAERIGELLLSRRNAAVMAPHGAIEVGQRHFRVMKLLHTAFFVACAAEVILLRRPFAPLLGVPMLILLVLAQGLRYWAVLTLGTRWNVRVLVVPGDAAVVTGPYRYLRHPNYLAVIVEGFAVPLVHSAWLTALAFTALNAALLRVRIRCEEAALATHCGYAERFATRHRFIPGPRAAT